MLNLKIVSENLYCDPDLLLKAMPLVLKKGPNR